VPVEEAVTIGRGETNTVVLSQDRQVSRSHARVVREGETLRLEDLGSANGTLLNGERLQEARSLQEGDQFQVGGTRFRVESGVERPAPAAEVHGDSTVWVEDEEADKTISGAELEAELAKLGGLPLTAEAARGGIVVEATDVARLTITWGAQVGQSFNLDREVLVVGRAGAASEFDIALDDRAVSSPHAKLLRTGGRYLLQDLGSRNGTWLNYEQIQEARPLQDGDLVKLGKTVLLFRAAAGADVPPFADGRDLGQAQIITFFSLKGGVGTTTVALNTALLIRELTKESVVLVDLSVERASVVAHLNFEPRRTIDDLAHLPSPDPETIQGIAQHHPSGLDIMAAPRSPQTAELVTAELFSRVLPALKERYRWIVFDTAATFSELNLSAFDQADLVVVLTAPDLSTLKVTHNCLDVFSALQTTGERRLLLLNTIYPMAAFGREEMEKALGERIDLVVPYGAEVLQSIDHGVPLVLGNREHPIVDVLDGFVRKIAQVKEPAPSRAQRGGFWLNLRRLMRRQ
jgi:pSer/pThr/pTyr-binding forkhead associated (FHA) protein